MTNLGVDYLDEPMPAEYGHRRMAPNLREYENAPPGGRGPYCP